MVYGKSIYGWFRVPWWAPLFLGNAQGWTRCKPPSLPVLPAPVSCPGCCHVASCPLSLFGAFLSHGKIIYSCWRFISIIPRLIWMFLTWGYPPNHPKHGWPWLSIETDDRIPHLKILHLDVSVNEVKPPKNHPSNSPQKTWWMHLFGTIEKGYFISGGWDCTPKWLRRNSGMNWGTQSSDKPMCS